MRLAVTNQKGGVGKTTVAINTAGALAARGEDVLLIDGDPQGYLTMGVGLDDSYTEAEETFTDALRDPSEYALSDLVRTGHPEFDVVPASMSMFTLEQDLVSMMRGRERLQMLLDEHDGHDWILIDCPPSLGLLTDNALLGAGNVLIPAEAEDTSIRALELLFKQIQTLEQRFEETVTERGVVISNVKYPLDNEQQGMLDWFDDRFAERVPVREVRNRVAIKRAFNEGVSVFEYGDECDQEAVLLELADDLLAQEVDDE